MKLEIFNTMATPASRIKLDLLERDKSFADDGSAHITNSYFLEGNMALPDSLGSFIVEHTPLEDVPLESNHLCGIGIMGFLWMPHYFLHDVRWIDYGRANWVAWTQSNEVGIHRMMQHSTMQVLEGSSYHCIINR
jgi:hypothetical protein